MSAFPPATCRRIDFRDSDFGELLPFVRCQACGRVDRPERCSRQHRVARQRGGRRGPVFSSPVNGVVMCGSSTTPGGCHLVAESRDESDPRCREMRRRGFVITANQSPEILLAALVATPLELWDGRVVWPTFTGKWLLEAPAGVTR